MLFVSFFLLVTYGSYTGTNFLFPTLFGDANYFVVRHCGWWHDEVVCVQQEEHPARLTTSWWIPALKQPEPRQTADGNDGGGGGYVAALTPAVGVRAVR